MTVNTLLSSPATVLAVILGSVYARRRVKAWARHFMASLDEDRSSHAEQFGLPSPDQDLEEILAIAVSQAYWKGVVLVLLCVFVLELSDDNMLIAAGLFFGLLIFLAIRPSPTSEARLGRRGLRSSLTDW